MPYLTAATHKIDGFYEDELRKNEKYENVAILYAKISADKTYDFEKPQMSYGQWITTNSYDHNYKEIGKTFITEPVSMQTVMRWEQGGNIVDAFKIGIKEGMQSVNNAVAELIKNSSQAATELKGMFTGNSSMSDDQMRKINLMMRKARRKIINASSAYKNYGGSDTTINIPQLEFTFVASDFKNTHLTKAKTLLNYLLPTVETKGDKNDSMTGNEADDAKKEKIVKDIEKASSWMYEYAPNGYVNPAMGFDTKHIQGTFGLQIGGTKIKELIPTNVTVVQSRIRVLSDKDYDEKDAKTSCMRNFYDDALYLKVTNCNDASSVPLVIKILVQFEFAKFITQQDYTEVFFESLNKGYDIKFSL